MLNNTIAIQEKNINNEIVKIVNVRKLYENLENGERTKELNNAK